MLALVKLADISIAYLAEKVKDDNPNTYREWL